MQNIIELFSSFQGEGQYVGIRQIFIRFAGCSLSCFYCDTAYARASHPKFCTVFDNTGRKKIIENPIPADHVLDLVEELHTPDVHSICYTGGEPLLSSAFVKEIAMKAKRRHFKNFIETSGCSTNAFASLAEYFEFASIDMKLRTHQAVREKDYERLYEQELDCVRIAVDRGIETIVKVVVLKQTSAEEIEKICRDLSGLDIKFVLQPVTAPRHLLEVAPGSKELFTLSAVAGRFLPDVMVIPQVHKVLGIL